MNVIKIENAKERFFESKEQYLEFLKNWKDFHNSGKAKGEFIIDSYTGEKRKATPLMAEHYFLYNLLRGYPSDRGFTPRKKVDEYTRPYERLRIAYISTYSLLTTFKEEKGLGSWAEREDKRRRELLLLPFGDTFNKEEVVKLMSVLENAFIHFDEDGQQ